MPESAHLPFLTKIRQRALTESAVHSTHISGLAMSLLAALTTISASPACGADVRPWRDYHAIMWVGDSAYQEPAKFPLFLQRLREMGIDTGMVHGQANADIYVRNNFPFYVENMVNKGLCLKWNSTVIDWDKFVTEWARKGRPESSLVRDYCLDDEEWQNWALAQVQTLARSNARHSPLAYDIRDELSTTISANPFDYDFHPKALREFRDWLNSQYRDVAALNSEWETHFTSWDQVMPFTTDQVKNRMATGETSATGKPDWGTVQKLKFDLSAARLKPALWNFAPWMDFRTYMDLSLSRVLFRLRTAAHGVDPLTPVGIEGTQMPHAFGGYDLWRLSQSLDWVEPYDIGNAREIFGSFMAGKPILSTVFESTTETARRRLWHLLLEGDRGCIIWWSEDCLNWKDPEYALTSKAKALAPVLREMTSPLAKLFLRSERIRDPIYIHYSQASIQADWLIESTVDGSTWLRRFSSFESEHNQQMKVRNAWLKLFQDQGYSPQFLSTEQIEAGALRGSGNLLLVCPSSWALSDAEAKEIGALLNANPVPSGVSRGVFFDGTPGVFDRHGKLRRGSVLEPFCPSFESSQARVAALLAGRKPEVRFGDIAQHGIDRAMQTNNLPWAEWAARQMVSFPPAVKVPVTARVRVHRFQARGARLLAFERNINYQMSEELKQAGGNEALEKPLEVEARLEKRAHVYDLWRNEYLGERDTIRFTLDPWRPSLYAVATNRLSEAEVIAIITPE